MSKAERRERDGALRSELAQERSKQSAVDELSTMFENKKKIKILIKENLPFGGYSPGLAGMGRSNPGASPQIYKLGKDTNLGKDGAMSAKIVLHRNGKVLLIKNHKGWDLPGGHIKEAENLVTGLMREVFEETGLTLSREDIKDLNLQHKNKKFFCGTFNTDDVQLSDEHYEFGFFTLDEVLKSKDIFKPFKEAIKKCMKDDYNKGITLKITGAGSAYIPAGSR